MGVKRAAQRGMVALLLLMLLAAAALAAVMRRSDPSNERDLTGRQVTAAKLAKVERALLGFVIQNKRLPCPALGRDLSLQAEADRGAERRAVDPTLGAVCSVTETNATLRAEQTDGVVPWLTLGLARADVLDGWGNLLTYRVFPELVKGGSLEITTCDLGGGGSGQDVGSPPLRRCRPCNLKSQANCTHPNLYTSGWGLTVSAPGGQLLMNPNGSGLTNNGAAYVVISHGENGAGAFSAEGGAIQGGAAAGTDELPNAVTALFAPWTSSYTANALPVFRDMTPSQREDSSYFDDVILRPTILEVIYSANLGPRSKPQ